MTNSMRDPERTPFDSWSLFAFLAYLSAACLVLGPFTDINAPKWFLIRMAGPLLLAIAWLRATWAGRGFPRLDALTMIMLLYTALHLASLPTATNVGYGLERTSNVIGLVATFMLAAQICRDPRARDATLWMLLAIGAITSAYGISQHHGYDFFPWREASEVPIDRGVSFFGHATFTASVLIQIIPIGTALAVATRGTPRVVALALTIPMVYHLSFTGARMATVAFLASAVAAGCCWLFARRTRGNGIRRPARAVAVAALVSLIAVGVGGWFVTRAWQEKGSDLFAIRQSSLALRLYNWETASRMIYANPLLGVGVGNYEIESPRYWSEVEQMWFARNGRWMQQAHNDYLQTAAELGMPGVALLLALFAYALVMAVEIAARARDVTERWIGVGLFAAIVALGLDANTTFSLQVPGSALIWAVVLALVSATYARLPGSSPSDTA